MWGGGGRGGKGADEYLNSLSLSTFTTLHAILVKMSMQRQEEEEQEWSD